MSKKKAKYKNNRLAKLGNFLDDNFLVIFMIAFCISFELIYFIGVFRMAGFI